MRFSLIQTTLHWENSEKNLDHFNQLIDSINTQPDLIILPEMFTTGFTMNPSKLAEPTNGTTLNWLKKKANEKNCTILGSVAIKEHKKFYNRLFWVEPNGQVSEYNKRHLFRMAKEDQFYSGGQTKLIKSLGDFKICPMVCYDLRFPVWCRNTYYKTNGSYTAAYDVLIFVANWPAARAYPWKQLLIARAIENQAYVIGLNRVGADGNGIDHSGDSLVINPKGEIISNIPANETYIETLDLEINELIEFRKSFPVGFDADDFNLV